MSGVPRLFEPYLHIPYAKGGRDRDGCDCWGLTRLIYREQHGIELKEHAINPANVKAVSAAFEAPFNRSDWIECCPGTPKPFDVFLMFTMRERTSGGVLRYLGHCGLVVAETKLLHTEEATGPVVVSLSDPFISPRLKARFRHKDLT